MSELPDTTGEIRNPDGTFKPGVTGNPAGRPKGSISIKDKVRQYLEANPTEVEAIVAHFVKNNRELMWQMLEGRPQQQTDVTSGGDAIQPVLVKFLDGKQPENNTDTRGV